MRRALVGLLGIGLLAGCGTASAPATVRPTLAAIEALGPRCGAAMKGNVPSGLFQWSCGGLLAGAAASIQVDGNDEGVAGITFVSDGSADAALAATGFGRVVDAVPPLRTAAILKTALAGWTGAQQQRVIGGVRVSAQCNSTGCSVIVMPAGDALRPLPLP